MFTEEDLKRLKDHVQFCKASCQTCAELRMPQLIARLEAAEKVCQWMITDQRYLLGSHDDLDQWRKAAGK